MSEDDIRYYKGKHKVKVVLKSKGNYLVEALEDIPYPVKIVQQDATFTIHSGKLSQTHMLKGTRIVTVPRLLWRRQRNAKKETVHR